MNINVNIGEYIHKIIIKYNAAKGQTDENGDQIYDWQPLFSKPLYAKKTGLMGRLFYQAAAAQVEDDVLFNIRYVSGIEAGMMIFEGGESFEIKVSPVDVDGKRQWLDLHARQVLINGS